MTFSFPNYLETSTVSELENYIIDICNTCKDFESLSSQSAPLWQWAGQILKKTSNELRHEIEVHELDEHFSDAYHEEKDHLLKLPVVLLHYLNS